MQLSLHLDSFSTVKYASTRGTITSACCFSVGTLFACTARDAKKRASALLDHECCTQSATARLPEREREREIAPMTHQQRLMSRCAAQRPQRKRLQSTKNFGTVAERGQPHLHAIEQRRAANQQCARNGEQMRVATKRVQIFAILQYATRTLNDA